MGVFNIVSKGTLGVNALILAGIVFGPATMSVLSMNFAAAGDGVSALAGGAQTVAGWAAAAPAV